MSDICNKQNARLRTALDLQGMDGLAEAAARQDLDTAGPNELPSRKPRGMLAIAFAVAREPMSVMLDAAGGGDLSSKAEER